MTRIMITWFDIINNNDLDGVVSVVDSKRSGILGEWRIEVTPTSITHKPNNLNHKMLPPVCDNKDIMERVGSMAKTYHAGLTKKENIYTWIE
jgi:hypothetical protein